MKYMHSEWKGRLKHWKETLKQDLYLPLGDIPLEGFTTMAHITPEEASKGPFAPIPFGTRWGHTYEYCWLRGCVTLPREAAERRIVMNLRTGGEATILWTERPLALTAPTG